ncbi:uncharacterized protein LOC144353407 [Saccoglossus kowalevskii]
MADTGLQTESNKKRQRRSPRLANLEAACVSSPDRKKRRVSDGVSDKKKKKQRRSSFVRGKNRRSLPAADVDIYKRIPNDLPAEDRLLALHNIAACDIFVKLEQELPVVDLTALKKEAPTELAKTIERFREDGTVQKVCGHSRSTPNPSNTQMKSDISTCTEYMQQLNSESEKWEDLLTIYTEISDRTKSQMSEVTATAPAMKSLPGEHSTLLNGIPDLNRMALWVDNATHKLPFQVDTIHKTMKQVDKCVSYAELVIENQTNMLATLTSQPVEAKDIIKSMFTTDKK